MPIVHDPATGKFTSTAGGGKRTPYLGKVPAGHVRWKNPDGTPGGVVHSTAKVHPTATIEPKAVVGAHTSIGAGARVARGANVGTNVQIHSGAFVGHRITVGNGAVFGENASVTSGLAVKPGFHVPANTETLWMPRAELTPYLPEGYTPGRRSPRKARP